VHGRIRRLVDRLASWLDRSSTQPELYFVAGTKLFEWERHEEALDPLSKAYGHAVAADNVEAAQDSLANLASATSKAGDSAAAARWRAVYTLIETNGLGKLKPGRNEPCLCGSGQKFKRCCGR
jgi:uncharacterized protein YecA (UPF0149 family)